MAGFDWFVECDIPSGLLEYNAYFWLAEYVSAIQCLPLLIYNISNYMNSTFLAFEIQYIWRKEYQLLEYAISANIIHFF
jgi:hypothetical protein